MLVYILQRNVEAARIKSAVRNFLKLLSCNLLEDAKEGYTGKLIYLYITPYSSEFNNLLISELKKEGLEIINNSCSRKIDSVKEIQIKIGLSWKNESKEIEYGDSKSYHISI